MLFCHKTWMQHWEQCHWERNHTHTHTHTHQWYTEEFYSYEIKVNGWEKVNVEKITLFVNSLVKSWVIGITFYKISELS